MKKSKRHGLMKLSSDIVEVNTESLSEALAYIRFVPVSVRFLYQGYYEYIGLSKYFREVEEGEMSPYYKLEINCDKSGKFLSANVEEM
jgi:hypothetical protein